MVFFFSTCTYLIGGGEIKERINDELYLSNAKFLISIEKLKLFREQTTEYVCHVIGSLVVMQLGTLIMELADL
jgi:hypothetical protein